MTKSPNIYLRHVTVSILTASAILLSIQLGLAMSLQPTLVKLSSSRHHISFCRGPMICQLSAAVDETDLMQETQVAKDWDNQFEELLSFQAKYDHCNFPQNGPAKLTKEFPMLASFCQDQRMEYTANRRIEQATRMTLSTFDRRVRLRKLKEIGFEFNLLQTRWFDRYHELVTYRNENGHVRVSEKENLSLFHWVRCQRRKRKGTNGRAPHSEGQVTLLDNIGFEWESELYDVTWYARYNELVDFREQHGHLGVETYSPLYNWMTKQRGRPLSDEQMQMLDDIEFPWVPNRREARWHANYNDLACFQKDHGHCKPGRATHNNLVDWSCSQRVRRKQGLLSEDEIELLDKIDFPWEANSKDWNNMYRELQDYHDEKGHLRVGRDDDPNLYDWMDTQRKRYLGVVKRSMTDAAIERLEEMSFCWSLDGKERAWHEKYTEAVEFYKEHDHIGVTKKSNPSLCNWIETQGKRYKEAKGQKPLSSEELELLEQLDFSFFENQPRVTWNAMYADLVKYQKEHDRRFPTRHKDDLDLNRWMRQQRNRMRGAYGCVPLSDEQNSALEGIDFPMLHQNAHLRFWYEKYDELFGFRQQHGHFLVDPKGDPKLYAWIRSQRFKYGGTHLVTIPLSKSQIYLLDRIGFPWASDRDEVVWQMRYDELVQFGKEHGHLRIRKQHKKPSLCTWIKYQRQRYRNENTTDLSEYQIKQLEKIGFRWS